MSAGQARQLPLQVRLGQFQLGGERYRVDPDPVAVRLDVSRTTGDGYALRLRFAAGLAGPCMRCLEPADPGFEVDAREVSQPGAGDELESPYVEHGLLDLAAWARDALALALPTQILCMAECAGLCSICGADLNLAESEHDHDQTPDPRWAKLSELRFDR